MKVLALVVCLGVLGYVLYKYFKKDDSSGSDTPSGGGGGGGGGGVYNSDGTPSSTGSLK